jgi:hypothetical protein
LFVGMDADGTLNPVFIDKIDCAGISCAHTGCRSGGQTPAGRDVQGPGPPSPVDRDLGLLRSVVLASLAPMRGRLRRRADPPLF